MSAVAVLVPSTIFFVYPFRQHMDWMFYAHPLVILCFRLIDWNELETIVYTIYEFYCKFERKFMRLNSIATKMKNIPNKLKA